MAMLVGWSRVKYRKINIEWLVMNFSIHFHDPQRMNSNGFGDPLTFHLSVTSRLEYLVQSEMFSLQYDELQ